MDINNEYTLSELFGDEVALVIPDIQRDFCWGATSHFTSGIVHLFLTGRPYGLGLLYGYELPPGSRHLHIIDGQQRLTTLYLLLGMLYRRTPTPELRRLLIGDQALIDNYEPKLVYQAKREAYYFMSDLVMHFFLDRDGRLSQLEKSNWYYASYGTDPTVQNFIGAIRLIDEVLEDAAKKYPEWDFARFADFVANQVKFYYYDLGRRDEAEKMFITINTTNEPLTLAQNVRALSMAATDNITEIGHKWNEIEDWMWQLRDSGYTIDDLIRFYLSSLNSPTDFSFDDFYNIWQAIKRIYECLLKAPSHRMPKQKNELEFAFRPTIEYALKWQSAIDDKNLMEIWEFFANITRYQKPAVDDTKNACLLIEHMSAPDLVSLLHARRASQRILNEEEKTKLRFLERNSNMRHKAMDLIHTAQSHPLLNGRVAQVLEWCQWNEHCTSGVTQSELQRLEHYTNAIYAIWPGNIDCNRDLDELRRALLAIRHNQYPIVRRGDSVLSLCWNDYDWQRLMLIAPGLIRQFIDRCESFDAHSLRQTRLRIIDRFSDRAYPYYFLIKDGAPLRECRKRQLLRPSAPFLGIYDYECAYVRWWVDQQELPTLDSWRTWRAYGAMCLYTDHLAYNLSIDLYYCPEEKKKYKIEIFGRDESRRREPIDIRDLVSTLGCKFYYDRKRRRHAFFTNSPLPIISEIMALE